MKGLFDLVNEFYSYTEKEGLDREDLVIGYLNNKLIDYKAMVILNEIRKIEGNFSINLINKLIEC